MTITVILCTYNRCNSLVKALESVAASRMPDSVEWEVIVVDNNSNDKTRPVIEDYCRRYPGRFRYLFESRPGKSHALNAAIRATDADVLAFMDDDVQVDSKWLHLLTSCLDKGQWAGAGGRILPEVEFAPPRWLDTSVRYALAPLAMFDLGQEAEELREAPFGTNMAFRRSMFAKHGDFRTDLGPRPGSEIRNEDVEFGQRLLDAGERFWYEPAAVVYHAISKNRLNPTYFLTWWFDKSRADVRQNGVQRGTKWYIGAIPMYLIRRLCVWSVRWMCSINPRRRFTNKLKVWGICGAMAECRSLRASGASLQPCAYANPHAQDRD